MLQPHAFPETRPSLLACLRDGESPTSSWREFFQRYAPAVFRVARLRHLDANDADDIVQQVMLAVAKHIGSFDYNKDRGAFRNWVRQIAERKIKDFFRSRRDADIQDCFVPEAADERPSLEALWRQQWQIQDMQWCLDQVAVDFAPRRMEAFRLYVLEGVSAADVAKRCGITTGHVYVIRAHVVAKVRQLMHGLSAQGGNP